MLDFVCWICRIRNNNAEGLQNHSAHPAWLSFYAGINRYELYARHDPSRHDLMKDLAKQKIISSGTTSISDAPSNSLFVSSSCFLFSSVCFSRASFLQFSINPVKPSTEKSARTGSSTNQPRQGLSFCSLQPHFLLTNFA